MTAIRLRFFVRGVVKVAALVVLLQGRAGGAAIRASLMHGRVSMMLVPALVRGIAPGVIDGLTRWPHSRFMHSMAARSAIASTGIGILSTAGTLAALRFAGAIQPAVLDVAVPVGLVVVSVLLLRRQEWLAAFLAAWAGTLWNLTGVAGLLSDPLEPVLLRLALVPHALVIGAVLCLPYGDLTGRRRTLALAALGVALLAGAGWGFGRGPDLGAAGKHRHGGCPGWGHGQHSPRQLCRGSRRWSSVPASCCWGYWPPGLACVPWPMASTCSCSGQRWQWP